MKLLPKEKSSDILFPTMHKKNLKTALKITKIRIIIIIFAKNQIWYHHLSREIPNQ